MVDIIDPRCPVCADPHMVHKPSDNLKASSDATQNTTATSYTKIKEITVSDYAPKISGKDIGKLRIKFNLKSDNQVEKAFSYNGNTTVFTDETTDINSETVNDVALPPIQITSINDSIYFGAATKIEGLIVLNVGTAGVHSGVTLQWQYWNGSIWTVLTVTDNTSFFTVAGTNTITFTAPADWATTTVNAYSAYWIRCIVTALATPVLTTAPLGTQGWLQVPAYGRIYKNGAALGTERINNTTIYSTFSEDLEFASGDLIQLYAKVSSVSTAFISSFRVYSDGICLSCGYNDSMLVKHSWT